MGGFLTAQLAEWSGERGFGFLRRGPRRIFLHVSDFSGAHCDLKVGETFRFEMGRDEQGRTCAINASIVRSQRNAKPAQKPAQKPAPSERVKPARTPREALRATDAAIVIALLALPTFSGMFWDIDWRIPAAWFGFISAITYFVYGHDKRRAEGGGWRIPERSLHVLELLGGWPGAFLAQRTLRHKCSKLGYQVVFWLIVASYQLAAFDSLNDWRFSKIIGQTIGIVRK